MCIHPIMNNHYGMNAQGVVTGPGCPSLSDSWESPADPQDPEFSRKQLLKIDEWMYLVASCSLCPSLTSCPSPWSPFYSLFH